VNTALINTGIGANGTIVDEEYTTHVTSTQDVEDSLVQKPQGI